MSTHTTINGDTHTLPVEPSVLDAVSNAQYHNPHEVLGAHLGTGGQEGTVTVRVLRPMAASVRIITSGGELPAFHEHNGVFAAVLPASGSEDGGWTVPDYRVRATYANGDTLLEDDPYRHLPQIGDLDTYLFSEGRHERLWEALGAHVRHFDDPMGDIDGTAFGVWGHGWHADAVPPRGCARSVRAD